MRRLPVEPVRPAVQPDDVPQPLLNIIQHWRMHAGAGGEGSMGDATPAPVVIPRDSHAAALLDDYTLRMRYAWEQERRKEWAARYLCPPGRAGLESYP